MVHPTLREIGGMVGRKVNLPALPGTKFSFGRRLARLLSSRPSSFSFYWRDELGLGRPRKSAVSRPISLARRPPSASFQGASA